MQRHEAGSCPLLQGARIGLGGFPPLAIFKGDLAVANNIRLQRGALVLYENGAIVDRTDCPEHVTFKKSECTCYMIVRIVYVEERLAQVIFDAVFLGRIDRKGSLH